MERLRKKGIKLTPQRLAILEYLEGNTAHPTAEDVHAAVRKRHPTMSHATVYNTLRTLRDHGEVLELTIDPGRKHYDPNTQPHHHIICVGCGSIADVFQDFDVSIPEELDREYEILGSQIEFHGLCRDCRGKTGG